MMSRKVFNNNVEMIDMVDKAICTLIVTFFILSGGKPVSPIVYHILESCYDVTLPTYSIPELLDIIDSGNKQMAMTRYISTMKIEINSYRKLLDTLKTKDINYIQVAGYKQGIAQLKIEGASNVYKTKALMSNIKVSDDLKIVVDYLNDEEVVLTIMKGV